MEGMNGMESIKLELKRIKDLVGKWIRANDGKLNLRDIDHGLMEQVLRSRDRCGLTATEFASAIGLRVQQVARILYVRNQGKRKAAKQSGPARKLAVFAYN